MSIRQCNSSLPGSERGFHAHITGKVARILCGDMVLLFAGFPAWSLPSSLRLLSVPQMSARARHLNYRALAGQAPRLISNRLQADSTPPKPGSCVSFVILGCWTPRCWFRGAVTAAAPVLPVRDWSTSPRRRPSVPYKILSILHGPEQDAHSSASGIGKNIILKTGAVPTGR